MKDVRILTAGEQGVVVEFGNKIDPVINTRVHGLGRLLMQHNSGEIKEVVPTYRSLLVYFDPAAISRQQLIDKITALLANGDSNTDAAAGANVISIPVCYGGEYGPDIGFVAEHNGLTEAEVISIHTSEPYLVYMIGFTPGFPYLGGMSERIATPRLKQPRTRIPAGSVGIAGTQTGFYPLEAPGGWQLIGRTPVKGFDPRSARPFLAAAGDYLHFRAISASEFESIAREAAAGTYLPVITKLDRKGGGAQ